MKRNFLLLIVVFIGYLQAQQNSGELQEEQDYAFSYGLFDDKLYQLSFEQFKKFIDQYPNSVKRPDAIFLSAESQFRLNQYQSAISIFKNFTQDYPKHKLRLDALFRLGEMNYALTMYKDAIPFYREIYEKYPLIDQAGEAAYWIGECYLKLNDVTNAQIYFKVSYERYPKHRLVDYALYSIGWTFERKKEYPKAIEVYQKLLTEKKESDLFSATSVRIGECYFQSRDYKKCIEYLIQTKPTLSDSTEVQRSEYLIGEWYYSLADYPKAKNQYAEFLQKYPKSIIFRDVKYSYAWTFLNLKEYDRAAVLFGELTNGNDDISHKSMFRKGRSLQLSGKIDSALASYLQVIAVRSNGDLSDNAYYESGMIYFEKKDYDKALQSFQNITKKFPQSDVIADAYRMIGETIRLGMFLAYSKNGNSFMCAGTELSPSRLKQMFDMYFENDAQKNQQKEGKFDTLSLEYALSQFFSPKQKDLFKKKMEGLLLTKTEKEYFSRSVKKKLVALANVELHHMAQKMVVRS